MNMLARFRKVNDPFYLRESAERQLKPDWRIFIFRKY